MHLVWALIRFSDFYAIALVLLFIRRLSETCPGVVNGLVSMSRLDALTRLQSLTLRHHFEFILGQIVGKFHFR